MNRQFAIQSLPINNVTRTELIDAIETIQPRAGSVLAALDGLATAGAVTLTSAADGAKTMSTTPAALLAALESRTVLTNSGAVDLTKAVTLLNAASGSFALTLGSGTYDGQEVFVIFVDSGSTATWTASGLGNLTNASGFVMSAASHSLHLKWNTLQSKWVMVGGNCLLS